MRADYLAQTAEYELPRDADEWVKARMAEMRAEGIQIARQTWEPAKKILLIEGWKDKHADQSVAPEWQLVAA